MPQHKAPEYLYVTAVSGLSLREQPDLQSNKLTVMPLGSKVKVLENDNSTNLNVGGIDGKMAAVEYNNLQGFAFNGFMSKFLPTGDKAVAKDYAENLKSAFPEVSYSESKGDSVSRPKKIQTLLLPTEKWHEAFFVAQQLYDIPRQFAFPTPKGSNNEVQKDSHKKKGIETSELRIQRNNNLLEKITYLSVMPKYGWTVTITKEGNFMKIERTEGIR